MSKLTDKRFWAGIAKKESYREGIQALLDTYNEHKDNLAVVLPQSLRRVFAEKGTREEFERPYFSKRKFTTASALLALIYPEHDEYLAMLKQNILSICEESSWAVPAHCTDTADETTCVDLFSSETAGMLAEIFVLLSDRLGENIGERIKKEIERRVLEPYHNNTYWWDSGFNNWTAVCCANIGIAMMSVSPERFEENKARIMSSMKAFIDAFPDDGNCTEGLAYWHFGFGCWVWFADALGEYSGGKINLFNNPKIAKIASYAQKVFMKGGATVSIGDSSRKGRADEGLLAYLYEKYPSECVVLPKELTGNVVTGVSWLSRSRWLLYGVGVRHETTLPRANYLFENCGQLIVNLEKYSLFVKAGHNGESHNHNDVGSFILSTENGQVLCDLGSGKYFKGYFDDDVRYTLLNNASWGHSVPIIDGQYQRTGTEYRGSLSWTGNKITVDFAGAYDGAVEALMRSFSYDENGVTLSDEWQGCSEVVERFITLIEPKIIVGGVQIEEVLLTCANAVPKISTGSYETHGMQSTLQTVYIIDFVFCGTERSDFRISVS